MAPFGHERGELVEDLDEGRVITRAGQVHDGFEFTYELAAFWELEVFVLLWRTRRRFLLFCKKSVTIFFGLGLRFKWLLLYRDRSRRLLGLILQLPRRGPGF